MKPGDVVTHCRSGRRMTIEAINGDFAACAWFVGGELFRKEIAVRYLAPLGMALA